MSDEQLGPTQQTISEAADRMARKAFDGGEPPENEVIDRIERSLRVAHDADRRRQADLAADARDRERLRVERTRHDIHLDHLRSTYEMKHAAATALVAEKRRMQYPRIARSWLATGASAVAIASGVLFVEANVRSSLPFPSGQAAKAALSVIGHS